MEYKDYIDLGFIRTDTDDIVVLNKCGYGGYFLTKNLTSRVSVVVHHNTLDTPIMMINKGKEGDFVHRVRLTPEQVRDMFKTE
jgi:hypothetical protein